MKTSKVKIQSSKGKLAVVIHYPKRKEHKLAVLCPGYLDSKDYPHLVGLAKKLVKDRYTVVRFDPTGTWESDGDISNYTTTQYLDDIRHVINYMLKKYSYKYILVGGHSIGGHVAILYAARDQRVSVALGIMAPPGDYGRKIIPAHEEWKKNGFKVGFREVPSKNEKRKKFSVPFTHLVDRKKYDASKDVKNVKVPLILISGELDDVVLPSWVKKIYDNANQPKKFIIIPGIGHDYRLKKEEIDIVNNKIIEILKEL